MIPSAPQYSAPLMMRTPSMFSTARSAAMTMSPPDRSNYLPDGASALKVPNCRAVSRKSPKSKSTGVRKLASAFSLAAKSDWTSSTKRSALRRAPGMVMRHSGYLPGGIPDVPRMMARKASSADPTSKQLAARARFSAAGGPMERWQAFRQEHPGVGPKELSAMWKAAGMATGKARQPRRPMHSEEALRFARLVAAAKKAKSPYVWHSSRVKPGVQRHARLRDLQFMGHPYGEAWTDADGVLHGSGHVRG
jgi:hypothetical protein